MNAYLINLCRDNVSRAEVEGKTVLEVGSCNVNGSFRAVLEALNPREYLGVDIAEGPGVDKVLDIYNLGELGDESFDIVVCTETIEHVEDWRKAVTNLMKVLKIGGMILLTSRSKGFVRHDYPGDYWRYEIEDIHFIFQDLQIHTLVKDEHDEHSYGFFLKARKISDRIPDFSKHSLYNINTDPRQGPLNNNIQRTLN